MISTNGPKKVVFVTPVAARIARLKSQAQGLDLRFTPDAKGALHEVSSGGVDAVVADVGLTQGDAMKLFESLRHIGAETSSLITLPKGVVGNATASLAIPEDCQPDVLNTAIDRAVHLRQTITAPPVAEFVRGIDRLPSLPRTYFQLLELTSQPEVAMDEVAALVESDPALVVRLLQLVNSVYFGLRQRTTSIRQAISFLGFNSLKSLVVTAHVFASFEKAPSRSFSLEHFQMYSLRAARLARRLMHALDPRLEEEAYTAAIVHDIGKLVLALRHPAELEVVQQRIVQQGESARQAELAVLGVSHAEIGAHLLATWGIPFNVVESTAFHDHPSDVKGKPGEVLVVTHFADAASGILTCGDPETKIDNDLLVRAGVAEQRAKWMATCKEEVSTWA